MVNIRIHVVKVLAVPVTQTLQGRFQGELMEIGPCLNFLTGDKTTTAG